MCTGQEKGASPPQTAIRLHNVDPRDVGAPRPPTESRHSQSRKGEAPSLSRRPDQPASSSHGNRKQQGSSHGKRRPSTSDPSPRKDVHSSSSSRRPKTSREHASHRSADSHGRTRFNAIPEYRPVQYTEDQAIISRVAELHTLIDQHAANFYCLDEDVGNGIFEPVLDDPRTRHAAIRGRIARTIIDGIIMAQRDSSNTALRNTATQLSSDFTHYAFAQTKDQRESHLLELCKLGAELRALMSSNPSTWEFGEWEDMRGQDIHYGYMMVFPALLQDDEQAAPRQIFRI